VFPFTQNFVDRAIRGDYFNLHVDLDLSIPRLKRGLMLGTHWGQLDQPLVPAPGGPYYLNYTLDPMHNPVRPPWVGGGPGPAPGPPLPGPPPGAVLTPSAGLGQAPGPAPGPATAPTEGGG
jgi:phospholipid/cholesterol/gamma-HCH transport system substrate-binding protein